MLVINAHDLILGRLAAFTAKRLLTGEEVIIVNAGDAVITGSKEFLFRHFKQRYDRRNLGNPTLGPLYPKSPEGIVYRAVRGMLDYKHPRGKEALMKLKVFYDVPEKYTTFTDVKLSALRSSKYLRVCEISRYLGWKG